MRSVVAGIGRANPDANLSGFVALESRNNVILAHEPAWRRFIDEVCDFLAEDGDGKPRSVTPSGTVIPAAP